MKKHIDAKVTLVGAGPGDPDLMTIAGVKALQDATVILYDALVNKEIMKHAPQAKKIFVGKRLGYKRYKQEEINYLLLVNAMEYGWVADCYAQDVIPGQLLCPSSVCVGSEKLNIGSSFGPGESGSGAAKAPPARRLVTLKTAGADEQTRLINAAIDGYNTNYASSWHMVRSEPVFASGVTVGGLKDWYSSSGVQNCLGPLTLQQMDSGDVPAPAIPLLGCATQGDVNQSSGTGDGVLSLNIDPNLGLTQGVPVAESFNDGPSFANATGDAILLVPAATPRTSFLTTRYPKRGEPGVADIPLQDTRDWYAYHNNSVNLVFADGSVRSIEDTNKDGYINPGFAIGSGATSVSTGYLSSETESNPWDLYPGVLLKGTFPTKKFEQ